MLNKVIIIAIFAIALLFAATSKAQTRSRTELDPNLATEAGVACRLGPDCPPPKSNIRRILMGLDEASDVVDHIGCDKNEPAAKADCNPPDGIILRQLSQGGFKCTGALLSAEFYHSFKHNLKLCARELFKGQSIEKVYADHRRIHSPGSMLNGKLSVHDLGRAMDLARLTFEFKDGTQKTFDYVKALQPVLDAETIVDGKPYVDLEKVDAPEWTEFWMPFRDCMSSMGEKYEGNLDVGWVLMANIDYFGFGLAYNEHSKEKRDKNHKDHVHLSIGIPDHISECEARKDAHGNPVVYSGY